MTTSVQLKDVPAPGKRSGGAEPMLPMRSLAILAGAWIVAGVFLIFGSRWLSDPLQPLVALVVFCVLLASILTAAFGVVGEADFLARQLGEPYGTLILALAIVTIEVILIATVLLGPGDNATIGRDSIFAVMMVIMNLVIGVNLILASRGGSEQTYNHQGTTAYLSMAVLLTGMALVLPRFTSGEGEFSSSQALGMAVLTAVLYTAFLWKQMRTHRRFFMQPKAGEMSISAQQAQEQARKAGADSGRVGTKKLLVRSAVMIGMIIPIVLMAHDLAVVTDYGIDLIGAPEAVSGVLIAFIVFTPESITAVRAVLNNELQRSINLCLGSFVATVGLSLPVVLLIGLFSGQRVVMGISDTEVVLLVLTMLVSMLSFNGQRTSPLQGYMHIALFIVFGVLLFNP